MNKAYLLWNDGSKITLNGGGSVLLNISSKKLVDSVSSIRKVHSNSAARTTISSGNIRSVTAIADSDSIIIITP